MLSLSCLYICLQFLNFSIHSRNIGFQLLHTFTSLWIARIEQRPQVPLVTLRSAFAASVSRDPDIEQTIDAQIQTQIDGMIGPFDKDRKWHTCNTDDIVTGRRYNWKR
ncbi:hypothetical protein TWF132_005248 [Orbilia oligospora]|nr:hypothetical protein TWF751_005589 [Orbilia oligospora]KAF3292892.1 hypothetical protein TWF132_005248 [Orbilia oligospora]